MSKFSGVLPMVNELAPKKKKCGYDNDDKRPHISVNKPCEKRVMYKTVEIMNCWCAAEEINLIKWIRLCVCISMLEVTVQ